jgi:hypothetical protein
VRLALWRRHKGALFAEAWEDLCRTAIHRLEGVPGVSAASDSSPWLPASRWWRGNAPEWDVVTAAVDGSAALLGEVKWSAEPFEDARLETIAQDLLGRPLPSGVPGNVVRVIFVPRSASGKGETRGGVRVVEAGAVLRSLI